MKQATSTFISDVEATQDAIEGSIREKNGNELSLVTLEPKTTRNCRPWKKRFEPASSKHSVQTNMKRSAGGEGPSTGEGKRAKLKTQPTLSLFQRDTPNGAFETVDPAWEFCKLAQCRTMCKITSLLAPNGKELFYSISADARKKENLRVEILVRRSPGAVPESGLHYRVDERYAGSNVEEAVLTLSILPRNRPPEVHVDGWYRDLSLRYAKKDGDSVTVPALIFYFGILLADMVIKARYPSVREDEVRLTLFANGGEALQRYYHEVFGFEWDNKTKDYENERGATMHTELWLAIERGVETLLHPPHPVHVALTDLAAAVKPAHAPSVREPKV